MFQDADDLGRVGLEAWRWSVQAVERADQLASPGLRVVGANLTNGLVAARLPHRDRKPLRSRSEEHTSELQSQSNLVCRLLLEKKKKINSDKDVSKNNRASIDILRNYSHQSQPNYTTDLIVMDNKPQLSRYAACHNDC